MACWRIVIKDMTKPLFTILSSFQTIVDKGFVFFRFVKNME